MIDLCEFDGPLTTEEQEVRACVRRFCDEQVLRSSNSYWQRARIPATLIRKLGKLGVVGGSIAGHGCPGMSFVAEGLVAAELARADGSVRDTLAAHGLAMTAIDLFGSEEQKTRWLPRLATLDAIAAFALTEAGHGSDATTLNTVAEREQDAYILNGDKRWHHRSRPDRPMGFLD